MNPPVAPSSPSPLPKSLLLASCPAFASLSPEDAELNFQKRQGLPHFDLACRVFLGDDDPLDEKATAVEAPPRSLRKRAAEFTFCMEPTVPLGQQRLESAIQKWADENPSPLPDVEKLLVTLVMLDESMHSFDDYATIVLHALLWICGHSRKLLSLLMDFKNMQWNVDPECFRMIRLALHRLFPLPLAEHDDDEESNTPRLKMFAAVKYNLSAAYNLQRTSPDLLEALRQYGTDRIEPFDAAMYGNIRLLQFLVCDKKTAPGRYPGRKRESKNVPYDLEFRVDTEAGPISFCLCYAAKSGHLHVCRWICAQSPKPSILALRDGIWGASDARSMGVLEFLLRFWRESGEGSEEGKRETKRLRGGADVVDDGPHGEGESYNEFISRMVKSGLDEGGSVAVLEKLGAYGILGEFVEAEGMEGKGAKRELLKELGRRRGCKGEVSKFIEGKMRI